MCFCVKKNVRKRRFLEDINWEEKFYDFFRKIGNGEWKQFGRVLGVSDSKIKEIEYDCSINKDSLYEKLY